MYIVEDQKCKMMDYVLYVSTHCKMLLFIQSGIIQTGILRITAGPAYYADVCKIGSSNRRSFLVVRVMFRSIHSLLSPKNISIHSRLNAPHSNLKKY